MLAVICDVSQSFIWQWRRLHTELMKTNIGALLGSNTFIFTPSVGPLQILFKGFVSWSMGLIFRRPWCLQRTTLWVLCLPVGVSYLNVTFCPSALRRCCWLSDTSVVCLDVRFCILSVVNCREARGLQRQSVLRQPQHQDHAVGGPSDPRVSTERWRRSHRKWPHRFVSHLKPGEFSPEHEIFTHDEQNWDRKDKSPAFRGTIQLCWSGQVQEFMS